MATFTKEDLLGIAKLSALELRDDEVDVLTRQIGAIIAHVDELQEVDTTVLADAVRNQNIFRDDIVHPGNADLILEQAPQREERYFVVPKILD